MTTEQNVDGSPKKQKLEPVKQMYVKPWEMDMTVIFVDILRTISTMPLKDYMVLRGGIALSMFLSQNPELIRRTTDIDLDIRVWEAWDNFAVNSAKLLTDGSKAGYTYTSEGRANTANINGTDSLFLSCCFGGEHPVRFKIDMNVRVVDDVVITEEGIKLASVSNMLCDKLAVLATNRILHRIKDLYDVYTISFVGDIVMQELLNEWYKTYRDEGVKSVYTFNAANHGGVQKVYERIDRLAGKADFQTVLARALQFASAFYTLIANKEQISGLRWNEVSGKWQ